MWDWLLAGVLPEVADQWQYATVTLVVRFIGVFVVMGVMQLALQASAAAVRAFEKRPAGPAHSNPAPVATIPTEVVASTSKESALDDATVAAIGLALALESRQPSAASPIGGSSTWSSAWRMRQLPRSTGR